MDINIHICINTNGSCSLQPLVKATITNVIPCVRNINPEKLSDPETKRNLAKWRVVAKNIFQYEGTNSEEPGRTAKFVSGNSIRRTPLQLGQDQSW